MRAQTIGSFGAFMLAIPALAILIVLVFAIIGSFVPNEILGHVGVLGVMALGVIWSGLVLAASAPLLVVAAVGVILARKMSGTWSWLLSIARPRLGVTWIVGFIFALCCALPLARYGPQLVERFVGWSPIHVE